MKFASILFVGLLLVVTRPIEGSRNEYSLIWIPNSCVFKCSTPLGSTVTIPPTSNGCQSFGIGLPIVNQNQTLLLNQCCNSLQACYNKCGWSKNSCDLAFQGCLQNVCPPSFYGYGSRRGRSRDIKKENLEKNCKSLSKQIKYFKNNCANYLNAQKKACNC